MTIDKIIIRMRKCVKDHTFGATNTYTGEVDNELANDIDTFADQLEQAIKAEREKRQVFVAKWKLGPEYEYAYCSHCGNAVWAGWDCSSEARDEIGEFHHKFKFCPNCGASMVEGVYINGKGKNHGGK